MSRRMVIEREDGSRPILVESLADDESQMQELVKNNPDLLPIDEFGMTGPLLVVGRETSLPSGAVDLVAIARSGEILIVEFKTGPQNGDFRHVLAQLLDYGSDVWQMSFIDRFEAAVVQRYLRGPFCTDPKLRGKNGFAEAASAVWDSLTEPELAQLKERLSEALANGAFHYVVVAQRFAPTTETTVKYLNTISQGARFYMVELVRFLSGKVGAFEARTVLKPEPNRSARQTTPIGLERLLESAVTVEHRDALREIVELCEGLNLRIFWGASGISIRLQTPDRSDPLSIGWLFPTGTGGWMGLRDFNLGFDPTIVSVVPSIAAILEDYLSRVKLLPGAEPVKTRALRAYHFGPAAMVDCRTQIVEILAELVQRANASA